MTQDAPLFNHSSAVIEGWYWLCRARELRKGQVRALRLLGRDIAVFRGASGAVSALDAYCVHMGAHLAEGRVERDALRCFFHCWRYEADGRVSDIPCLEGSPPAHLRARHWPTAEAHGMIWLWTGNQAPAHAVPQVPELTGIDCDVLIANRFIKQCHPNVVLINAIDEQHFHSVHHLPGSILRMQALPRDTHNIEFHNQGVMPRQRWLGRFLASFYRDKLTYNMSYWYGSLGFVTLGPDFLHLYLMFALRRGDRGETEGQTIAFTRRRRGVAGWLFNRVVLVATALAARYFAHGDTRVFQTIRFQLANPIGADRAVLAFMRHLEAQPLATQWMADSALTEASAKAPALKRVAGGLTHHG